MSLFAPQDAPPRCVSLARLSAEVAGAVSGLGRVTVEGDVHRPKRSGTGRVWFSLADRTAAVSVACPPGGPPGRFRAVDGERVAVTGTLRYWAGRGTLHLEAEEVVPVGASAVAAAIAEARTRLAADGLLDRARRRLPRLPAVVGVVCGAEAAVRADIESVVAARGGYPVVFAEVPVSGPGAADAMVRALAFLDARPEVEVIVLARGGGDAAQLLPFSDEALCRAVCACATPVVSAVGHEIDRPLCDEVADRRFPTPSLAAGAVIPDRAALGAELVALEEVGREALERRLAEAGARLGAADRRRGAAVALAAAAEARLGHGRARLELASPARALRAASARLDGDRRQLDALSPARVLARGYAVVRDADGRVLRRADAVAVGDAVMVQLAEGRLRARAESTEP